MKGIVVIILFVGFIGVLTKKCENDGEKCKHKHSCCTPEMKCMPIKKTCGGICHENYCKNFTSMNSHKPKGALCDTDCECANGQKCKHPSGKYCGGACPCKFITPPEDVQIVSSTSSFSVIAGEHITLSCSAKGSQEFAFEWIKDLSVTSVTGSDFRISNASADNAGQYTCMVSNAAGSSSASVTVKVMSPPENVEIISSSSYFSVVVGEHITLSCLAKGSEEFAFQWTKDSAVSVGSGSDFIISNASVNSAGTYTCMVSNLAGSSSASVTVVVISPPGVVEISSDSSYISVDLGQQITLSCSAKLSKDFAYQWTKDSSFNLVTGPEFTISSASAESAGQYTCMVSNAAGSSNATVRVVVIFPPFGVQIDTSSPANSMEIGDSITMICSASGTPPLSYQWTKEQSLILETTSSFAISSVTIEDSGLYKCTVSNVAGASSATTNVNVVDTPTCVPLMNINGVTYCLVDEKKTWYEAKDDCKRRQKKLVDLTSVDEFNNIYALSYVAWTGGNDIAIEGTYVWDYINEKIDFDKMENSFNYITKDEHLNCIIVFDDGFANRDCLEKQNWICENI